MIRSALTGSKSKQTQQRSVQSNGSSTAKEFAQRKATGAERAASQPCSSVSISEFDKKTVKPDSYSVVEPDPRDLIQSRIIDILSLSYQKSDLDLLYAALPAEDIEELELLDEMINSRTSDGELDDAEDQEIMSAIESFSLGSYVLVLKDPSDSYYSKSQFSNDVRLLRESADLGEVFDYESVAKKVSDVAEEISRSESRVDIDLDIGETRIVKSGEHHVLLYALTKSNFDTESITRKVFSLTINLNGRMFVIGTYARKNNVSSFVQQAEWLDEIISCLEDY